jgi:hypothetical protein
LEIDELSTFTHEKLVELLVALCAENAALKKQLEDLQRKSNRSANRFSKDNPKKNPKKPGRKGRKNGDRGDFKQREAPVEKPGDQVQDIKAPLENDHDGVCPKCGGPLDIKIDLATTIDIPEALLRSIKRYHVEVCECPQCGYRERGMHPDLPSDQYGATAHRVGPRITALGLSLHYHYGVTMRKVPAILNEVYNIKLGQSALTQVALKLGTDGGAINAEAQRIKEIIQQSDYVHTDDTGWRTGGKQSHLMGFGSLVDQSVFYQIRWRHRAREVAEVISEIFKGVLNTDRFKSYDAAMFALITMQKCLSHLLKNLSTVLETKRGRARCFCEGLQKLLREGLQLWHDRRNEKLTTESYEKAGLELMAKLEHYLRPRELKDADNQRMLNEIGWHFDRGNVTTFLEDEKVEPTNNFAERFLRGAVIARKVSQCSKTERGADAYAAFKSVLETFALRKVPSIFTALADLITPTLVKS